MSTPAPIRCFVALLPPPEVEAFANAVIQELGDRYRTRTAKAPPHITLQPPFPWSLERLPDLEASLRSFVVGRSPLPITLDGFGAFRPRVLFIDVHKTPELRALQADLMEHLERDLAIVDLKNKHRGFSPHMTVASRRMSPAIFRKAWADLEPRTPRFEFVSDRLTLLIHQGQRWDVHQHLEFAQM